ncbi:hypothetical protein [Crocinitomix catalasitica]|uniref:hypothetical protein n=1 Tax=Crocinitomix catalasitica TaxID=184607 RepID=UPI0004810176|nr:hypothetical protein [Crocinitomix catalasitica]
MGKTNAIVFFYLLKEEVAKVYLNKNPSFNKSIHDWTGNEIRNFQDDLSNQLNERISERWFYSHLKPRENEKLPRIDMLNILSQYTGYENWDDFQIKNVDSLPKENDNQKVKKRSFSLRLIGMVFLAIGLGLIPYLQQKDTNLSYNFCFYDKDTHESIIDSTVEVTLLIEHESPLKLLSNKQGCITINSHEPVIKFIASAPYYLTDTIERKLTGQDILEKIELQRDDYALMISLFATSDVKDWEKRRRQLDRMISDEAIIFQITRDNKGMEMFNKNEFIDKLTTPLKSLGAIEIIETMYKNDKIINLRFIQE